MNPPKRLNQQAEAQQQAHSQHATEQQQAALEFASAEELLRHDALHTVVPPAMGQRLAESIRQEPPPPPRSWWKRLFGQ